MARIAYRFFLAGLVMAGSFVCCQVGYAAVNELSTKAEWGYTGKTGPDYWARLSPDFSVCASGKQQSPINIPIDFQEAANVLKLNYHQAPLSIIDDGTTELTFGKGSTIHASGHGIQVNFSGRRINEIMTIGDESFDLVEFHFHTPGENKWHGKTYPMEIHFVHQGSQGHVAVLGVFVKAGAENKDLDVVVRNLPAEEGKEYYLENEIINPAGLLPQHLSYYQYDGSLTTPPCREGVNWLVLEEPITASLEQIDALQKAAGGKNARPVQPLNKRKVTYHA